MASVIQPTASVPSLFRAATMVAPTDPSIDWSVGWAVRSSCPSGTTWCCEDGDTPAGVGELEFKPDPGTLTSRRFKPFTIVHVEGCEAGTSRTPASQREAEDLAQARLRAYTEGWVGRALATGICGAPGFSDDVNTFGLGVGSFSTLSEALAAMLADWANDEIFEKPIVHLPWSLAARPEDPLVRVAEMADIVFNPGYPPGTVYLSGRVEISVREPDSPATIQGSDTLEEQRRNATLFIEERMAVYRYDPCLLRMATVGGS